MRVTLRERDRRTGGRAGTVREREKARARERKRERERNKELADVRS